MKKALPWIVFVTIGYVLLVIACVVVIPKPWNYVAAGVVALMAMRFLFTLKATARLGARRGAPGAK